MPAPPARPFPVVVVLGPTASGKSRFAMALADRFAAEIVSFDSIKVYRGMDIGTDKPSAEEIARYRYHLVDIRSPAETMNAGEFIRMAEEKVEEILSRNRLPILEGGSALYLKAFIWGIFRGPGRDEALRRSLYEEARRQGPEALHRRLAALDPERAAELGPRDLKRIVRALEIARLTGLPPSRLRREWRRARPREGFAFLLLGLERPRAELYRLIDRRIERMMERGLLDEVARIWQAGAFGPTSREAIGYRQLLDYLEGRLELDEALRRIRRATRQFARRQEGWFKRFQGVRWFRAEGDRLPVEEAARYVQETLPVLAPRWRHLCRPGR